MAAVSLTVLSTLLLFMLVKPTSGSAEMQIRLVRLFNSRGQGANGHCCDGRSIFCFSQCDHQLTVCLDHAWGRGGASHCAYGRITTGEVTNKNNVYFSSNIGGTRNPLRFPLPQWPGRIKLKVNIIDRDDHNSNDFVDFLSTVVSFTPGRPSLSYSSTLTLRNRVTLVMEVTARCLAHHYGPQCTTGCWPKDDHTGHYTCDRRTGDKICLSGWRGTECLEIDRDDCLSQPCQHGGTCLQKVDGFTCLCPSHTQGDLCEKNTRDDCHGDSCPNNGTCQQLVAGNQCLCAELWTGAQCQTRLVTCSDLPCHHGGTCIGDPGDVSCVCPEGFTGQYCDTDIDECLQDTALCDHGGTCLNEPGTYSCACADGYTGQRCETSTDYCADEPCHFGGSCTSDATGFTCACVAGRTGMQCEEEIEECASIRCLHGGTCVEESNGYKCFCSEGFTGAHCDLVIDPCSRHPCQNEATCTRDGNDFRCVCADGFGGDRCEIDLTPPASETTLKTVATITGAQESENCTTVSPTGFTPPYKPAPWSQTARSDASPPSRDVSRVPTIVTSVSEIGKRLEVTDAMSTQSTTMQSEKFPSQPPPRPTTTHPVAYTSTEFGSSSSKNSMSLTTLSAISPHSRGVSDAPDDVLDTSVTHVPLSRAISTSVTSDAPALSRATADHVTTADTQEKKSTVQVTSRAPAPAAERDRAQTRWKSSQSVSSSEFPERTVAATQKKTTAELSETMPTSTLRVPEVPPRVTSLTDAETSEERPETSVKETAPRDSQKSAAESPPSGVKNLTLPFYVRGRLGEAETTALDRHLENLLRQYGGYPHAIVRVVSKREYVLLEDGTEATEVTFKAVINRTNLLRREDLQRALHKVPAVDIETLLPYPLVYGIPVQSAVSHHIGPASEASSELPVPEWYVFIAVAVGIVAVLVLAYVVFRRRKSIRRKLSDVTILYRRRTSSSAPLPPVFDNNIYFVASPVPEDEMQPTVEPGTQAENGDVLRSFSN